MSAKKGFSFRDLEIWQLGIQLAEEIYRLTSMFPKEEQFGLVSQMRRAAVSVPSNISEGYGRGSQPNLANSIRIARGSLAELETQVELAKLLGFLAEADYNEVLARIRRIGAKSYSFITKIETSSVREKLATYQDDQECGQQAPLILTPRSDSVYSRLT